MSTDLAARERQARLVQRALQGDPSAFGELVALYQRPLVSFAYRYLGSREEAEDAAQDAFVRVYLSLDRLREPEAFAGYLFATALNVCRKRAQRPLPPPPAAEADPSVEAQAMRRAERDRVAKAIAALPEEYRATVSLRAHEALSFAEIAAITGATEGACRVRYHRALEMLRTRLGVPAENAEETP
jgi:RNA polymerase sigma-70 factor (ECF subfamily)